ncbi:DUF1501 domain-containing protein [Schlesneria paludicola]|uniref:DUF1501 domain-containing protein n=1 Tax=Schlesneria paludicola TaxID=360056 RepID=UPI00029A928F|nr:DUF1501 domain-containing protein [Schlesneria paludicola]
MSLRFLAGEHERHGGINRREWLRIGGLAGMGLSSSLQSAVATADVTASPVRRAPGFGCAKSVIVLFASGGQSQLDTWDPKPDAPDTIRGEFDSIATSTSGLRICEHLPKLARLADRYTVIRNMSHDDLDHGSATYLSLTGQFHARRSSNPPPRPDDAPALGAVLQRVHPTSRFPHTAVNVNGPLLVPELPSPGQYGGFLGRRYEPLMIGDVFHSMAGIEGLQPQPELPLIRQSARVSLLETMDQAKRQFESNRHLSEMSELYRQARTLLESPQCRHAFDLTRESEQIRERYGSWRSGQACLLARRLVEAGVPLITVFLSHSARGQDKAPASTDEYGWDTHNDIFYAMKEHLLPRFDISFSALLEDLEERGLLDSTLVVCMGEFGRAPRIAREASFAGTSPGRKHWASVYSIVMAGAGVRRGHVVGASDRIAAYPESTPLTPGDVAATMFSSLGVDPTGHYLDATGRPWPLATGQPIAELYS